MPQLPKSFSAYPVSVDLDASGNGAVRFQAVGSNIRVSNLSVRASSSTAQAIATIYKNQIGEDYRLSGTNSGSTGDSVSVPVDLFDGEALIVVWSGGDAGATATATFSGKQLPFDQVGSGEGGSNWTSPIAAGDGSLVYPAIKSSNYTPGVSGWLLDRNGDADLNDVSVRGDLLVNGTGNENIHIYNNSGQAVIDLTPDSPNNSPARINAGDLTNIIPFLNLTSPAIPANADTARIIMYGGDANVPRIEMRSGAFDSSFLLDIVGGIETSNLINGGYTYIGTQVYTSSGTFIPANYPTGKLARIRLCGGGGGGGGADATGAAQWSFGDGGGGGESGFIDVLFSSMAASETVTVGTGGAGGSATGTSGNPSSFGTFIVCNGGGGGSFRQAATSIVGNASQNGSARGGGSGGSGGTRWRGISGGRGNGFGTATASVYGGDGGASAFSGAIPAPGSNSAGVAGASFGGGGTGASNSISQSARNGGNGTAGIVIVEVYG